MARAVDVVPGPVFSTFPVAKEDVALVVADDVTTAEVEAALREGAGEYLEAIRLFDVYTGDQVEAGHKSLAFALRFRAPDRHPDRAGDGRGSRRRGRPGRRALRGSATLTPWTCGCSTRCPGTAPRCRAGAPTRCWRPWWPRAGRSARSGWSTRCGGRTTCRPTRPRRSRSWSPAPAPRPLPRWWPGPTTATGSGCLPHAVDALALRDAVVGAREAEGRHDLIRARDLAPVGARAARAGQRGADGPLGELRDGSAARHRAIADRRARPRPVGASATTTRRSRCSQAAGADDEATVAALLRSTAAVHGGAGRARARTSGTAPTSPTGSASTRARPSRPLHGELLAADRPVRERAALRGRPRWSAATTTSARCVPLVREARVTSILGPGGLGQDPAGAPARPRRPSSRSCTSSSWSASPRPRTSSARSAPPSACATRSAAAGC